MTQPPRPVWFGPSVDSPEVDSDGRITFRFKAPHARAVALMWSGPGSVTLSKDEAGVWQGITAPLEPDIYDYAFVVDGEAQPDPANPWIKSTFRMGLGQSLVQVRASEPQVWDEAPVPHGAVTRRIVDSVVTGEAGELWVYTPPGYDLARLQPYPVLYLLHGFSDEAGAWITAGRAHLILDNLIARGLAAPMLVVMPLGYGAPAMVRRDRFREPGLEGLNVAAFSETLRGEVLPLVEKAYHVAVTPAGRAVAGLSMGGAQALHAGLALPGLFGCIGAFSTAADMLGPDWSGALPGAAPAAPPVWMACGADDPFLPANHRLKTWLEGQGAAVNFSETPGGHVWSAWRRHLAALAPTLFSDWPRETSRPPDSPGRE